MEQRSLKERMAEHLVIGGLVLGCGIVSVLDVIVFKPYFFVRDLFDRCR